MLVPIRPLVIMLARFLLEVLLLYSKNLRILISFLVLLLPAPFSFYL